ncbi:MAG TPA: VOC family protein [Gammaproteobacteria bacterium]|nr:VOC family protein [Gammaproteobacteria bacterium]
MTIKGGINHVTLRVQNLARSEAFYCGLLGLKRVGERRGMAFYSSGHYNHELALMEDPAITPQAIAQGGLMHIAFNVSDEAALKALYQRMIEAGHPVSEGVDHVISHAFYTRDADGYTVEITTDMPRETWENNPSAFRHDKSMEIQTSNQ